MSAWRDLNIVTSTGAAAVDDCLAAYSAGVTPQAETERAAVQQLLAVLTARAPGRSVEVRIPPFAAAQIVAGPTHRRGTPSATVQMSARTFIEISCAAIGWSDAVADGLIRASGERSDLSELFPL